MKEHLKSNALHASEIFQHILRNLHVKGIAPRDRLSGPMKELTKSNALHASEIFQRLLCNLYVSEKALRDRLRGPS